VPLAEAAAQISSTLAWSQGESREIRIIDAGTPRHAIVSSPEAAADAIKDVPYGDAVYTTVNPIGQGDSLQPRVGKSLVLAQRGAGAKDNAIARRTVFVIDLDPQREPDTSASCAGLAHGTRRAPTARSIVAGSTNRVEVQNRGVRGA
jgi:hypothetical protein